MAAKNLRHRQRRVVVASECDPQEIVNYNRYFKWLGRNYERLFRDAKLSYSEFSITSISTASRWWR